MSLFRPSLNWNLRANAFSAYRVRPLLCSIIFFCFAVLALSSQVRAQDPNLDEVADQLVQQLKKTEKKHFPPRILVIDFASRPGGIKAIGEYLANSLSDTLAQKIDVDAIIDRRKLHTYLLSGGISPFDLADRDISIWIGSQLGANVIIFGSVASSHEKLVLTTNAFRINDRKHIGSSKADLPLNDQLKEILAKSLEWPTSPDIIVACLASGPGETEKALDEFKAAGITMPTCIHCPDPAYTDEARKAGIQGSVKFDVIVDEQGKPKRIAVVQGDRYGLTARALEAIKKWQFKPAMKNGKPVTVCVLVEVGFRLV